MTIPTTKFDGDNASTGLPVPTPKDNTPKVLIGIGVTVLVGLICLVYWFVTK